MRSDAINFRITVAFVVHTMNTDENLPNWSNITFCFQVAQVIFQLQSFRNCPVHTQKMCASTGKM